MVSKVGATSHHDGLEVGVGRVGFAAVEVEGLEGVLEEWAAKSGRRVVEMRCMLKAEQS